MIPMGFAMYLEDEELAALVIPRSGLGILNMGLFLEILLALLDSDYPRRIDEFACMNRIK